MVVVVVFWQEALLRRNCSARTKHRSGVGLLHGELIHLSFRARGIRSSHAVHSCDGVPACQCHNALYSVCSVKDTTSRLVLFVFLRYRN